MFFTNNLISNNFLQCWSKQRNFPLTPQRICFSVMEVTHFLNIYNPTGTSNGPLRGPRGFLLPMKVSYKQTPNQRYAVLSFWMWEKNKCEKGEKGKARKNQQDINCFEANRHRLIENLEINDFRIHLPPNNNNHHKNKPKQNTKRVPNSQCPA